MRTEVAPKPRYVAADGRQLRVWQAGEGPAVIVLPGLLRAPSVWARDIATHLPGYSVSAVEVPGIGGSAHLDCTDLGATADLIADLVAQSEGPAVLVAADFSAPLAVLVTRLAGPGIASTICLDIEAFREHAARKRPAPDTRLRSDGSHLTALWNHVRDCDMFAPNDGTRARSSGGPFHSAEDMDAMITCFGVAPEKYSELWQQAISNAGLVEGSALQSVQVATDLPALADLVGPGDRRPSSSLSLAVRPAGAEVWSDYADIRRGRVHVRRAGDTGRPVLALYAGPGSAARIDPVVAGLSKSYSVIAPDYMGQGDSSRVGVDTTMVDLVNDVFDTADALGIESFDIYGTHSGAKIAVEAAIARPERVGRLVLDGLALASRTSWFEQYFPPIVPDQWGLYLQQVWHMRRDANLFHPWFDRRPEAVRRRSLTSLTDLQKVVIDTLKSRTMPAYRVGLVYDIVPRLPLLETPALICAGPQDDLFGQLDRVRTIAPASGEVREVPATLWLANQSPEAVAETLRIYTEFLG